MSASGIYNATFLLYVDLFTTFAAQMIVNNPAPPTRMKSTSHTYNFPFPSLSFIAFQGGNCCALVLSGTHNIPYRAFRRRQIRAPAEGSLRVYIYDYETKQYKQ